MFEGLVFSSDYKNFRLHVTVIEYAYRNNHHVRNFYHKFQDLLKHSKTIAICIIFTILYKINKQKGKESF